MLMRMHMARVSVLHQLEKQTEAFGCRYAEASGDDGRHGKTDGALGQGAFPPAFDNTEAGTVSL